MRHVRLSFYTGTLYRSAGAPFGPGYDPSRFTNTPLGAATLAFANGNAATWTYTVGATGGSKAMTRYLLGAPAGTACQ